MNEMGKKEHIETLVILSPGFPADESDTVCLPAQQAFIRAVNKMFPQIKILILALHYPRHEKEYVWNGNSVIPFNGNRYGRVLRPLLWLKVMNRLAQFLNTYPQPGVLSFWYSETALLGHWVTRRHQHIHYCWILGQDARKKNHYVGWTKIPAQSLIAISDSIVDEFKRNHKISPGHTIRNGIDPDQFPPPVEKDIDIIGVGSLIPLKQYRLLIEVVARLKPNHPRIKAILCGTGSEEKSLTRLVVEKELEEHVTFTGETPHPEVLKLLRRSKVLVHPSQYEGYSSSCLEALFAGCHVISFTKPEHNDIDHWHVVENTGEIIDTCNKLLTSEKSFTSVHVRSMDDSAVKMINLFSRMRAPRATDDATYR